jgi:cytochrome c peroxidase
LRAIASYERSLVSFNSPFDRFIAGDANAIGDSAKRGWELFNTARQAEQLVASGDPAAIDRAALQTDMSALGRFLITRKEADTASFKTPNLRNVQGRRRAKSLAGRRHATARLD